MPKKYNDKEIECPNCHKKIIPLKKLNRVKSEFIGATFTGNDKTYWKICPKCKSIIGTR